MKTGTKSVLFGAHAFWLHPWFVFAAWWKLYGFPRDPRLWLAFFVHDLGYVGKARMDDADGERHVEFGAWVMTRLFDRRPHMQPGCVWVAHHGEPWWTCGEWGQFCLFHSRFYAKKFGHAVSQLAIADKVSTSLMPWWLYLLLVILSGEIHEYMALAGGKGDSKYAGEPNSPYVAAKIATGRRRDWFEGMSRFQYEWAMAHKDGQPDTWTQQKRES